MADKKAVHLALVRPQGSRGAPWSPIALIHPLVALVVEFIETQSDPD